MGGAESEIFVPVLCQFWDRLGGYFFVVKFSAAFHIWEKLGVRSLLSLKRFLRFIFIFGTNGAVFATDAQWRPRP